MELSFLKLKHSIARKLLTIVFSLYTIVTVSVTVLHMYFEYEGASERITDDLKFYASMIQPPLSEAIWNFSNNGVQTTIQGISKSPSLVGLKVLDERGNQWNAGYAPSDQTPGSLAFFDPQTGEVNIDKKQSARHSFNHTEDIFFTDNGEKIHIGKLILYSSTSIVFGQVRDAFLIILLNAAIKIVALWALFLIYGYKLLTQPLEALTQATQAVRQGNFENPDLPTESTWPTEIEILNDNFNVMTHDLAQARVRLEAAQQRTRSIIDSMPSMIIGMTQSYQITDWNEHMVEFTGLKAQDVQDRVFTDVIPDYQFLKTVIDRAISEKTYQQIEKQSVYHGNKRYFQDILVYPIALDGQPGAVVRIDDVTNRIQLEQAMAQTAKLSSVGTLAAGMAHQISTPIGAISQGLQNIHRRLDPQLDANKEVASGLSLDLDQMTQYLEKRKITEFLTQVESSIAEASKILDNLLQFSKPSTSVKATTPIQNILNHALELAKSDYDLSKKFDFSKIKLNLDVPQDQLSVYVAVTDIEQVLLSLIKYSAQNMQYIDREKSLTIQVSSENQSVKIQLKDNGPGLDAAILEHIFDPFFTQKGQGEQVGMGLSVSYRAITEDHGGSLTLENAQPSGLIFTILLPVASR